MTPVSPSYYPSALGNMIRLEIDECMGLELTKKVFFLQAFSKKLDCIQTTPL